MNVALVLAGFWLPGLAAGAAIRLRGWTLAAAAPVLTFGVAGIGVWVLSRLGVSWNLLTAGLWTLAVIALLAFGSLLFARLRPASQDTEPSRSPRDHLLIGGGVAVGMGVGAVTFLRGIGSLTTLSQDWDAPFHGNVVRWIAEHDSALSSELAPLAGRPGDENFFYPDTYHALLALVFDRAGLGIPELLNLAGLAVILALPPGIAAVTAAWRMPTVAVAAAAAVSTWFTAFPYDSLWRGPLYPYVAGVALLPAVLAMARYTVRRRGLAGVAGVALGTAGLVALHTSLAVVVAVYFVLLLLALALRLEPVDWRTTWPYVLGAAAAGAVLALPLALPALSAAGEVTDFGWPSTATVAGGFGQAVTFSPDADLPQWWLGLPAIAGIVLLVRHRRMVWLAAAYVLFGGLYAATASMESPLIHALTGPFYNDQWRLGALVPFAGAVAFGEFAATVGDRLGERVRRWRPAWPHAAVATAGVMAFGLVVALLGNGAYVGRNVDRLDDRYGDGPAVSSGERAAFAWLAERVGPGERVMNGRLDGTCWMYALAGVRPVEWKFSGSPKGTPARVLTRHLDELGEGGSWDPLVRSALAELNVRYVLVGKGFVRPYNERAFGLRRLAGNQHFEVVYRNPKATVYLVSVPTGSDEARHSRR